MSILLVIPARWESSRLPGKPLADLGGRPVIAHVWERCSQAVSADRIVIATDDARIAAAVREFGARAEMTSADCLTGTDRVAEVAEREPADWYINVQGDEPFIEPASIEQIVEACLTAPDSVSAVNAMSPIKLESDFRSTTVPKVVTDETGRLLYISRAAIPTSKSLEFRTARRQVGLYGFRDRALRAFADSPAKTALEEIEDIEILRLLELGHEIRMIEVASDGPAVDTPDDLVHAHEHLRLLAERERSS